MVILLGISFQRIQNVQRWVKYMGNFDTKRVTKPILVRAPAGREQSSSWRHMYQEERKLVITTEKLPGNPYGNFLTENAYI